MTILFKPSNSKCARIDIDQSPGDRRLILPNAIQRKIEKKAATAIVTSNNTGQTMLATTINPTSQISIDARKLAMPLFC